MADQEMQDLSREFHKKQEAQKKREPKNSSREAQKKQKTEKEADQQMAGDHRRHQDRQELAGRGSNDHHDDDDHHYQPNFFKVHFVKCTLDDCLEFALNIDGLKKHLLEQHGFLYRCIATENCVRRKVGFVNR